MNESETRTEYILTALRKSGWGSVSGSRIREEYPISIGRLIGQGKRTKPKKADYLLQYKNLNLAIIEAKSIDKYYTEGVGQAKEYAGKLNIRFTYSTNGKNIYQIDMHKGIENDVDKFPTPDELWQMTFEESEKQNDDINEWKNKLFSVPFNNNGGLWQPRYYQELAVNNAVEAISNNQNRILLTLATGTGKTAIATQIVWKLFNTKWNINKDGLRTPRILFLADRNILANQAFNAFSFFEDDALVRISPDEIKKRGKVPKNGSIFFTIFQTFMSGPDNSPYFGDYPKDFFDLIIIDECHRGGVNDESTWRQILEYFSPAYQIGLTATPKRENNNDTYKYFGNPVYIYSLKEGINDGYLTPFKVKEIKTTIDEYIYTSDDTVTAGIIDKDKKYVEADMNKIIEIKQREEYRVKILLNHINQNEKTLVFCASQNHALAIRDLINQYSKSQNPDYCHRVTADDGLIGEQHLKHFQDNERNIPTVLTTSQKLSTGVDARDVRNIVLLRPVNSIIEFKQIIGRGTRLFDGKDFFTIFDFVEAHNHFHDKEWDGEPEEVEQIEPEPCPICKEINCVCVKEGDGVYDDPTGDITDPPPPNPPPPQIIKVKLSDGKVRQFQSMVKTSFYSPNGKPISAEEFLRSLFGTLPELFKNEDELRKIWSKPDTRKILLDALSDKGFTRVQLTEFQTLLNADRSDLYDVLSYIAFNSKILQRTERATNAKIHLINYDSKQQEFLNFVLNQYVNEGVDELDDAKIGDLLTLKYHALDDAKRELGDIKTIRESFINFQSHLYDNNIAV